MKVGDLITLQPLLQEMVSRQMPVKLAYAFTKNFRRINAELEDYYTTRIKALSENGFKQNKKTGKYIIPEEEKSKWKSIHEDLLNAEAGYMPYKIPPSLLDGTTFSPGELLVLWFMLDEEPDPILEEPPENPE